ncbi:MAG: sulfotransferase [Planctomycetota bacterium]
MSLFAYYGHHKAASTWIVTILNAVAADTGWKVAYLPEPRHFGGDLAGFVARNGIDLAAYVNADMEHLRGLPEHRAFHVVRDPRDIVVSAYHSHLSSHPTHDFPELIPHRKALEAATESEGLLLEIEFSGRFLRPMAAWDYGQPHVLELKQEELTRDPYGGFLRIFDHLGALDGSHYSKTNWPGYLLSSSLNILHARLRAVPRKKRRTIPGERLLGVVYDHRYEKMSSGRARGQTDAGSHYRSGRAGEWRERFGPRHVAAFKERYGDIVERLGYGPW